MWLWLSGPIFFSHNNIKCSLKKLILLVSQEVWTWACVGFEITQWLNSSIVTNSEGGFWVGFGGWGCFLFGWFGVCFLFLCFSLAFYPLTVSQQGVSQPEVAEFSSLSVCPPEKLKSQSHTNRPTGQEWKSYSGPSEAHSAMSSLLDLSRDCHNQQIFVFLQTWRILAPFPPLLITILLAWR